MVSLQMLLILALVFGKVYSNIPFKKAKLLDTFWTLKLVKLLEFALHTFMLGEGEEVFQDSRVTNFTVFEKIIYE